MKKGLFFLALLLVTVFGLQAQTTVNCYPISAANNTGTCTSSAITQSSLIQTTSIDVDRGWAKFDISSIPNGAIISNVELHAYGYEDTWAYFRVMQLSSDPLVAPAATIFTDCADGNQYYQYASNFPSPSWAVFDLGALADADLQAQLAADWFGVGFWEYETAGSYYIYFEGWNETNRPYVAVTYTVPGVPNIVVTPNTLNLGYAASGATTPELTYTISGTDLTGAPGNIVVTAPAGFAISLVTGGPYTTTVNVPYATATLAATTIYAVCQPVASNTMYSGNITNVGGGDSKNVAVSGNSYLPYCTSIPGSTADEEIYSVTLNGATNAFGCATVAPGPGSILNRYSNFMTLGSLTSVMQATTVPFTILEDECDGATYYNNGCGIWIDFNGDGDFDDIDEAVYIDAGMTISPRTISGNISIPLTATVGLTGMRIIVAEGYSGATLLPCMAYSFGETEDYLINITANTATCLLPTALTVTGITQTSATLGWTENNSATSWQIEYGLQGFSLGTGTRTIVASNPTTISSGLSANNDYSFYVRSICAAGDTSTWSVVSSFTTLCGTNILPFTETFDGTTIPNCWNMFGPDVWYFITGWPMYGAAAVVEHTGNGGSYAGVDGSVPYPLDSITLESPTIDLGTATNPVLDFWMFNDNIDDISSQTLQIDMWNGAAWVSNIFFYDSTQNDPAWQNFVVDLSGYPVTGPVQFRLLVEKRGIQPFYDDLIIDDFRVYDAPVTDLGIFQSNIDDCDTIGLFAPPIQIYNAGNVTIPATSTIVATYQVNAAAPVVETLTFPSTVNPGDTATLFFTTPYLFNAFTSYNATFAISYVGDADLLNDTADFIVTFHGYPTVDLGSDTIVCADASIVLDAGNPGSTYFWWNGSATQTHPLDSAYCGGLGTCSFWVIVEDMYGCIDRDTINITWDPCSGISESNSIQMTIMPNPTNGVFAVDFGGLTGSTNVEISDLTGKVAISETLQLTGTEKRNYDLSSYGKGIYNIRIVNSNQVAVRKIVVN